MRIIAYRALFSAFAILLALNLWCPGNQVINQNLSQLLSLRSNITLTASQFFGEQVVREDVVKVHTEAALKKQESHPLLKVFDMAAFQAANVGNDAVDLKDCIVARYLKVSPASIKEVQYEILFFQPNFKICTYNRAKDQYVSGSIRSGQGWDTGSSRLFLKMLQNYDKEAIFIDAGTNIGIHALYIAKCGYPVYGVEPLPSNLNKVT